MKYVICPDPGYIRTDSKAQWWHCTSGFSERTESEMKALLGADQQQAVPEINVTVSPLPPLTPEEGQELGMAFLYVMAIAWCFKQLRTLKP